VKDLAPDATSIHCMIHCQALTKSDAHFRLANNIK